MWQFDDHIGISLNKTCKYNIKHRRPTVNLTFGRSFASPSSAYVSTACPEQNMTTGSQNPQHPPASHNRSSPHPPTLRRRPVPRRGHKKSRAGCGTCKSRKVKCDETTPECGPCARLGLGCWYPEQRLSPGSGPVSVSVSAPIPAGAPPVRALRTAPVSFSSDDLRFFQHFLFTAYPSLPIGGWEVWQQVGRMSHDVSMNLYEEPPFLVLR